MIAHSETYRFSASAFQRLDSHARVELLGGQIVALVPVGKHHGKAVRRLNRRLNQVLGDLCVVDCQNAFLLDDFSELQPDILLLRLEMNEADGLPRSLDIFVAIELVDSSLRYDATSKLKAYARGGISEYWIVNLAESCVDICREPQGEGYSVSFRRKAGESFSPAAFPDRILTVEEILP
jgi:Uma2 family endonuclease